MKKRENHERHEKLALMAFLITIIIAGGAFYYIWQLQTQYGRTVEGAAQYAQAQAYREMWDEWPAVHEQFKGTNGPCCVWLQNERNSQTYEYIPNGPCIENSRVKGLYIDKLRWKVMDVTDGYC